MKTLTHPRVSIVTSHERATYRRSVLYHMDPCWSDIQRVMRCKISAGDSDHVHVFREDSHILVLSINYRLDYVGLETYLIPAWDKTTYETVEKDGDVFFQDSPEIESVLGPKGLDLQESTIARRLYSHLLEVYA